MDTEQKKVVARSGLGMAGLAVVVIGVGLGGGFGIGNLMSPAPETTPAPEHPAVEIAHAEPAVEAPELFPTEIVELANPGDPMPAVMLTTDCLACHQVAFKVVGPAYQEVADKYQRDPAQVSKLARKVIQGGVGVWGQIPMTPHPQHSLEEAQQMVAWVLGQTTTPPAAPEEDPAVVEDAGGK